MRGKMEKSEVSASMYKLKTLNEQKANTEKYDRYYLFTKLNNELPYEGLAVMKLS
jgi:hypothetical protein